MLNETLFKYSALENGLETPSDTLWPKTYETLLRKAALPVSPLIHVGVSLLLATLFGLISSMHSAIFGLIVGLSVGYIGIEITPRILLARRSRSISYDALKLIEKFNLSLSETSSPEASFVLAVETLPNDDLRVALAPVVMEVQRGDSLTDCLSKDVGHLPGPAIKIVCFIINLISNSSSRNSPDVEASVNYLRELLERRTGWSDRFTFIGLGFFLSVALVLLCAAVSARMNNIDLLSFDIGASPVSLVGTLAFVTACLFAIRLIVFRISELWYAD